jgi:hypothetical protein
MAEAQVTTDATDEFGPQLQLNEAHDTKSR